MRRSWLVAALALVLVAAGGGLGAWWWAGRHEPAGRDLGDPAPRVTGDGTAVGPAGRTVRLDAVDVVVPPGAVAPGRQITVLPVAAIGEHHGEIFGQPVGVEHDAPLLKPVTLRWRTPGLTPRQRAAAVLTRWEPALRMWKVAGPRPTVQGDTLTVAVTGFSFWDWAASASQWTGQLVGKRIEAPRCNGRPLPGWVRGVVDPDADLAAAALRVCFEPDRDEIVTTRVANNRSFSQRLRLTPEHQSWAWTWPGPDKADPRSIVYLTARAVFDSDTSFLLPPLTEVAVGLGRPTTPGRQVQTITGHVDVVTVLADAIAYVFDQVPAGGADNPLVNAALQALLECGGKQALARPEATADGILRTVVRAITSCADEIVRPDSEFGARLEALEQQAIRAHPGTTAQTLARGDRLIHQLAYALRVLAYADLVFYLSDQVAQTAVGPLTLSVSGDGRPQRLGAWKPTCRDREVDSNRLYRNLALQDTFADKNRQLWQFPQWKSSARTAVGPLDGCDDAYLHALADYLPGDWGDEKAARVVAGQIRALTGFPAAPDARRLRQLGVCGGPCHITGTVYFNHPAYGPSALVTTVAADDVDPEAAIAVLDATLAVRWSHRAGSWFELSPAAPARDGTGHIFVNYNPGRYNGVIILNPSAGGFDTYRTLPPPGDYAQRFYSASLTDTNHDGRYEVDSAINDCDPDCATGTIHHTIYRWNGSDYVAQK